MKQITYYRVGYDGSTDLGGILSRKAFEKMDDAIAYLEENFPMFLKTHEHFRVLQEYKYQTTYGYYHQFALTENSNYVRTIMLKVERMTLNLE